MEVHKAWYAEKSMYTGITVAKAKGLVMACADGSTWLMPGLRRSECLNIMHGLCAEGYYDFIAHAHNEQIMPVSKEDKAQSR